MEALGKLECNEWLALSLNSHLRDREVQAGVDRSRGIATGTEQHTKDVSASARAVKSAELKKRVRKSFDELFAATVANRGGGWSIYEGSLNGPKVVVSVDFGGRHAQLRYEISVESISPPCKFERLSFETVIGVGSGDWDFIVEENVDDAMRLLAQFAEYVSLLPSRLPASCFTVGNNL